MATKIKICGITRPEDARCAVECGADFVGMIFAAKSRRCVSPEHAAIIAASLPQRTRPVGVFVNERNECVAAVVRQARLSVIQFHGGESAESAAQLMAQLADASGFEVWKALSADEPGLSDRAEDWCQEAGRLGFAAHVLIDSGQGGTGRPVDWVTAAQSLVHWYGSLKLAGGLTPENVGEAIRIVRPDVVDVSSGVESAPGIKDHAKIAAFCDAVRKADGR